MKEFKRIIKTSLCGLLSAAMLAASVTVPSVGIYAEEVNAEETAVEETAVEETSLVEDSVAVDTDSVVDTVLTEDSQDLEATEELELTEENVTANFYYYAGELDSEVKLYANVWSEGNFSTSVTDTVALNNWSTTYVMSAVEGHTGWYYMPMTFANGGIETTIKIILSTDTGVEKPLYTIGAWNETETYAKLTSGECANAYIKEGSLYTSIEEAEGAAPFEPYTVTFNYYRGINVGDKEVASLFGVFWDSKFTTTASSEKRKGGWETTAYKMEYVEGSEGWYTMSLTVAEKGSEGFELWSFDDADQFIDSVQFSQYNDATAYAKLLEAKNEDVFCVRNGKVYSSIAEADKDYYTQELKTQIEVAEGLAGSKALYSEESWNILEMKLERANEVLADDNYTYLGIKLAYEELKLAIESLETQKVKATINLTPVALSSDFITGADLSSYIALRESGVVFKDENGNALSDQEFFNYLKEGGTNWVRIRVWNDPYDGSGNGYGGGNNDIDKAVEIGRLATHAGMRVLIDFHYSDFWADPAKYKAPKAYANMTVDEKAEAVANFTKTSLNTLRSEDVDVGMVQVGNETNSGICDETSWDNMAKIFKAGSQAVRAVDENILIAVHYTDPQNGFDKYASKLKEYEIDYDVFGASYYPFWHGTTDQLTSSLSYVANTYGKKVMVAETSWTTTWEDGDGHENTAPKPSGQALNYDISVQGQADEMRDVVNAVNSAKNGIGVFYWEPAWISPYYVYNADGSVDANLLNANKTVWEKYGSGWAASYSAEYDPSDAGLWYGGSAIDNQSWFDFDGSALATAKAYALIRTGAEADKAISVISNPDDIEVAIGGEVTYPTTVTVKFNDGSEGSAEVQWDKDDIALVTTDRLGNYKVNGIASCTYEVGDNTYTEKKNVSLTVKVLANANLLKNPGFEEGHTSNWTYTGSTGAAKSGNDANNIRSGSKAVNVYFSEAGAFEMYQKVTGLSSGLYNFGIYIQGGSAGDNDKQVGFARVYDSEGNLKANYSSNVSLSGWLNWKNPELTGIKVEEGDYLEVGLKAVSTVDGAWAWIDDAYLYGSYSVNVSDDITNGQVVLSNYEAVAGEIVTVTAKPNANYKIKNVSFTGISDSFTTNPAGTYAEEDGKAVYTVDLEAANITDYKDIVFTMPESEVNITAEFVSLFDSDKIDISGNEDLIVSIADQYATGKAIIPAVKLEYKGYLLTKADYTVSFKNNKDVYTYTKADEEFDVTKAPTAIIKAKGTKFTGTKEVNFVIKDDVRIDLADKNNVKAEITSVYDNDVKKSFYYTGDELKPAVKVTYKQDGEEKVLETDKYTVSYTNNIKPGKASLTIVPADDSVKNSLQLNFTIEKRPVSTLRILTSAGGSYTGKAIKPVVQVKYSNKILKAGTDYTVAYFNNIKASDKAYFVVTCKGNYVGKSDKIFFTIKEKSLKDLAITMTAATLNETKSAQNVKVTLYNRITGKNLAASDYTIKTVEKLVDGSYQVQDDIKVKDAGKYKVTVEGKGNYTGEKTANFDVIDAAHNIANVKIKTTNKVYTGSAIKLTEDELKVTYGSGKNLKTLTPGTDYEVTYTNNLKVGTATVTLKGLNEYSGTKTASFKIGQAKIKQAFATSAEVTADAKEYIKWQLTVDKEGKTDDTAYTGYAITPALTLTYGPDNNTLVKDKDYTIVYSNNVKAGADANITIRGKGNYAGSLVIKNAFKVTDRKLSDFVVSIAPVQYTGKAIKPVITFRDKNTGESIDLKSTVAYTVSYKNNTNVAGKNSSKTPTVIIKEKGLNGSAVAKDKASLTCTFTITTAAIKSNSIANIATQKYVNKPLTPALKVSVNGRALRAGKDYVVVYSNNDRPGTATATVKGIGNYSGTVTKTFTIR